MASTAHIAGPKHLNPSDAARYAEIAAARRPLLSGTSQKIIILAIVLAITLACSSFSAPLWAVLRNDGSHAFGTTASTQAAIGNASGSAAVQEVALARESSAVSDAQLEPFMGLVSDGQPLRLSAATDMILSEASYTQKVGYLGRDDEKVKACEPLSMTVVLNAFGFGLEAADFVDGYLEIDGDYVKGYAGSPYGLGAGFAPGMVKAANAYLTERGSALRAHDLSGSSFDSLLALAEAGYPVAVWTTVALEQPESAGVYGGAEWFYNEHCVVLYGIQDGNVLVSDSLEGFVQRDADAFARIYETCGNRAAAIF